MHKRIVRSRVSIRWLVLLSCSGLFMVVLYTWFASSPDARLMQTIYIREAITAVCFNPSGELIGLGGRDGLLQIRRAADGQSVVSFEGHTGGVSAVAFSPDGQVLASTADDGMIRLWQVRTGTLLWSQGYTEGDGDTISAIGPLGEHRDLYAMAYSITFSPDGQSFAVGGDDGYILVFDTKTGRLIHRLRGHFLYGYNRVSSVAFSPDGTILASGGLDRRVYLWRVSDGDRIGIIEAVTPGASYILGLTFLADSAELALGRNTAEIERWSVPRRSLISAVDTQRSGTRSIAFSADAEQIAQGGGRFHDFEATTLIAERDPRILVLSRNNRQPPVMLVGHRDQVNSVAFSPRGPVLVSGSDDGTMRLWNVGQ